METSEIKNELHRKAIEMYLSGEPISNIVKETLYTRAAINNIVKRYGYKRNRKVRKCTLSDDEIFEMHKNGSTFEEIAKICNITVEHCKAKIELMNRSEIVESDDEKMKNAIKAKDRRTYRVVIAEGKRYTDVTDYFAGV